MAKEADEEQEVATEDEQKEVYEPERAKWEKWPGRLWPPWQIVVVWKLVRS